MVRLAVRSSIADHDFLQLEVVSPLRRCQDEISLLHSFGRLAVGRDPKAGCGLLTPEIGGVEAFGSDGW